MKNKIKISKVDQDHLLIIRKNVTRFIKQCAKQYDKNNKILLDIAPQDHAGAKEFFKKTKIKTLDINPSANCDYTADICKKNKKNIPNNSFDYILCTEVLEHTLNPFKAIDEIKRILKPEGMLFLSVPFNFRIHGPLPDCWRFTEYGINALLNEFKIIKMNIVNTDKRDLMPIHYTIIAKIIKK